MGAARIGRVTFKAGGAEVVPLRVVSVGEGYRFEPDKILSAALGQGFTQLAVIGELPSGEFWLSSMSNAGVTMILLERAKRQIVGGDD